jgi:hypothetical protein
VIPGINYSHILAPKASNYYSIPASQSVFTVTLRDFAVTNELVLSTNIHQCEPADDSSLPVVTVTGIYSFLLPASYSDEIILAVTSTGQEYVNYSLYFDEGNIMFMLIINGNRSLECHLI